MYCHPSLFQLLVIRALELRSPLQSKTTTNKTLCVCVCVLKISSVIHEIIKPVLGLSMEETEDMLKKLQDLVNIHRLAEQRIHVEVI